MLQCTKVWYTALVGCDGPRGIGIFPVFRRQFAPVNDFEANYEPSSRQLKLILEYQIADGLGGFRVHIRVNSAGRGKKGKHLIRLLV